MNPCATRLAAVPLQSPDEAAGWLRVFRRDDRLGHGWVLAASRSLALLDKLRRP
ncbi:hypothetical protein LXM55_12190 [Pseudomonas sp. Au-Pse12]|nr:hypothetical protein [Pseudomonas sp. Au-Pse12]